MIKKIQIIYLILFLGCKQNPNNKLKTLTNTNDTPKKIPKFYLSSLILQYSNNWVEIFSQLQKNNVTKLSQNEKDILSKDRKEITRDLKNHKELLNYFYKLIEICLFNSCEENKSNFTSEKARLEQELFNDMSKIFYELIAYDENHILQHLDALLVLFFKEKSEWGNFFNKEKNKNLFVKSKSGEPYNFDNLPLIYDEKKYEILNINPEDESKNKTDKKKSKTEAKPKHKLKEQIWINLIKLLKNIKPIDATKELKLKKEMFKIDTDSKLPFTSHTEETILSMCKNFGIKYTEDFSKVVSNDEDLQNFSLAFTTYVLRKFVDKFSSNQKGYICHQKAVKIEILASTEPLHFLGHQIIGLVLAIINTALIQNDIEKIGSKDKCLDLSNLFEENMTLDALMESIKKSLFSGIGFISKDKELNKWMEVIGIPQNDFQNMNCFATMDYRYIINFLRYQCFDDNIGDLANIKDKIFTTINTKEKEIVNSIFGKKGLKKDIKDNFFACSLAALNSMIFANGLGARTAYYYFFNFEKSEEFISIINSLTDKDEKNDTLKIVSQAISNKLKESSYDNILNRKRDSPEDYLAYNNLFKNILKPIYTEYESKVEKDNYSLKIYDDKGDLIDDIKNHKNFFLSILLRTYEGIGAYALLDNIEFGKHWVISSE